MKKIVLLFALGCVHISAINTVFAQDLVVSDEVLKEQISDNIKLPDEFNHSFNQIYADELLSAPKKTSRTMRTTRTVKVKSVEKTVSFLPAGQPSKGTKFSTGGSFYWSPTNSLDNGSVSISVGFTGVSMSFQIPTGILKQTTTDYCIKVTNKVNFVKLKVKEKRLFTQYAVYGREDGIGKEKFLYFVYSNQLINRTFEVIKV